MRLLEIGIKNFKSLRDVTFRPGALSVLIGPNGAGKSNLCEALNFIGEMYRSGLDAAMVAHGGYGNVALRAVEDADTPASFTVTASLSKHDLRPGTNGRVRDGVAREIVIRHRVVLSTCPSSADDPYHIAEESVRVDGKLKHKRSPERLLQIDRNAAGLQLQVSPAVREQSLPGDDLADGAMRRIASTALRARPLDLMPSLIESLLWPPLPASSALGAIALYRLETSALRQPGVPSPEPRLGRDGGNHPAVLRWLESHDCSVFQTIVGSTCTVDRSDDGLDVVETARKTLELRFQEARPRRQWSAGEASDGTLRALSLFTALLDPRTDVVVFEKPENSLYPWEIQSFIDACRELAEKQKQIIVTTHSPIVVDRVRPDDVRIVSKPEIETHVDRLADLDPDAKPAWEQGEIDLAYYLRSGIVPEATPAMPLSVLADPL